MRLIAGAQNDAGQWPYGEQTLYNAIKLIESQQREIENLKDTLSESPLSKAELVAQTNKATDLYEKALDEIDANRQEIQAYREALEKIADPCMNYQDWNGVTARIRLAEEILKKYLGK